MRESLTDGTCGLFAVPLLKLCESYEADNLLPCGAPREEHVPGLRDPCARTTAAQRTS